MNTILIELGYPSIKASLVGGERALNLSADALLLSSGWVFSPFADGPELEETAELIPYLCRWVRYEQAMARPGGIPVDTGERLHFSRIDYFAALFSTVHSQICPDISRQDIRLYVLVPTSAVCADEQLLRALKVPKRLQAAFPPEEAHKRDIHSFNVAPEECTSDIVKGASCAGFASIDLEPLSVAVARTLFAPGAPHLPAKTAGYLTDKANPACACVVELMPKGISFVALESDGGELSTIGQPIFVPFPWGEQLREIVERAVPVPSQRHAVWRRVRNIIAGGRCSPFLSGASRVELGTDFGAADWASLQEAILSWFQKSGLAPSHLATLLTLPDGNANIPIVAFTLIGFGARHEAIATAVAKACRGIPELAKAGDETQLGILDHSRVTTSPLFFGTPGPMSLEPHSHHQHIAAPKEGRSVYAALKAFPPKDYAGGKGVTIDLIACARPLLRRVTAMMETSAHPEFTVTLTTKSKQECTYSVIFRPQHWERSQRLELEIRVDDSDQVEIFTLIGGLPCHASIIPTQAKPEPEFAFLRLGHAELYADGEHRRVSRAIRLGRERSRNASLSDAFTEATLDGF